jgi:iron complex outermembrane receptor protein
MFKFFVMSCLMFISVVSKTQTIKINGSVKDSTTNEAAVAAEIYIAGQNIFALSDNKGNFSLAHVKAGSITILLNHIGCERKYYKISITKDTFIQLYLTHHLHQFETHVVHGHHDNEKGFTDHSKEITGRSLDLIQYKSLGEIVGEINGVQILSSGAAINKPVIRGMYGNRVSIITNGQKLESQQWGDEHAPEIDSRNASTISVIKGAGTLRYGHDALGGIIIIEPRTFKDTLSIMSGISLISQGLGGNVYAYLANKYKGIKWTLGTNFKKLGDQSAPNYHLSNSAFEEWSSNLNMEFNWNKVVFTTYLNLFNSRPGILKASHIGNLTDLESALNAAKPAVILPFSYQIGKPFQQVKHFSLVQKMVYKKNANEFLVQYGLQWNKRKEFDNRRNTSITTPQLDFSLLTNSLDLIFERHFKPTMKIQSGVQLNYQTNKQVGYLLIHNYNQLSTGFFGIGTIENKRYLLELGLRYDKQVLNAYYYDPLKAIVKSKKFDGLAINTSAQYQFNSDWMCFLQAAHLWRAPSINELYSFGLHHGAAAIEYGNEYLKSEQSTALATTLVYSHNKFGFEIEPHIRYVKNFISLQPLLPPVLTIRGAFPVFAFGAYNVWFKGIDMQWNFAPKTNWVLKGQYSVMQVRQNDGSFLNGMPPVTLDHNVKYLLPKFKQFSSTAFLIGYKYVLRQQWANANLDYAPPPKGYGLLRLSVSSILPTKRLMHQFAFSVENALNTSYRDYLSRFRYYADQQGINIIINYSINI